MIKMEVWKDIKGYDGYYQVSNYGNVRSLDRYILVNGHERLVKGCRLRKRVNHKTKYVDVNLYKNGIRKAFHIHRLVAMAFLEDYNEKLEVNHIDRCKLNNNVENLEMCTHEHNIKHNIYLQLFGGEN